MELEYTIKNFRIFDNNGASFRLKPITILTGQNCAGKSTLVKSLTALQSFLAKCIEGKDNYNPFITPLSFLDGRLNIKGLDSVYNRKNPTDKNVVFSYSLSPFSKSTRYGVEYVFSPRENDPFNSGWLSSLRITCNEETVLFIKQSQEGLNIEEYNIGGNLFEAFNRDLELLEYRNRWINAALESQFGSGTINGARVDVNISEIENALDYLYQKILSNHSNYAEHPFYDMNSSTEKFKEYLCIDEDEPLPPGVTVRPYPICAFGFKDSMDDQVSAAYSKVASLGIIMYLPIIETLNKLDVSKWQEFFLSRYRGVKKESFKSAVEHLVIDYCNSGCSSFSEYYKKKEKAILSSTIEKGNLVEEDKESIRSIIKSQGGSLIESLLNSFSLLRDPYYFSGEIDGEEFYRQTSPVFSDIYKILSICCCDEDERGAMESVLRAYSDIGLSGVNVSYTYIYELYRLYIEKLLTILLLPAGFKNIEHLESFLCPVEKKYQFATKSNVLSGILREYLDNKSLYLEKVKRKQSFVDVPYLFNSFTLKWVKSLGIGEDFDIKVSEDYDGASIYVTTDNGVESTVSMGHGVTQVLSILLTIENAIVRKILALEWSVEYPTCARELYEPSTICLEEPEISLHPSIQSRLAEVFKDAYECYNIQFIIETHSEYLIRGSQAIVAKGCLSESDLKNNPFIVYYLEDGGRGYDLEYQLSGRFSKSFGPGFFDEASRSSIEILKKERRMSSGQND